MRGIRGAITVERNDQEEIWQAAQELITELMRTNAIAPEDIGAAIFSVTEDLTAAFPTAGVRRIAGFDLVPLFDAQQSAEKLLSLSTLLYSVLYTQGVTTEEGAAVASQVPNVALADVNTQYSYLQLKPVLQALTESKSGRLGDWPKV